MEPAPGRPAGVERPCCPMPPMRPLERMPKADAAAPTKAARFRKPRRVTVFRAVVSFDPAIVLLGSCGQSATPDNCRRTLLDCKWEDRVSGQCLKAYAKFITNC